MESDMPVPLPPRSPKPVPVLPPRKSSVEAFRRVLLEERLCPAPLELVKDLELARRFVLSPEWGSLFDAATQAGRSWPVYRYLHERAKLYARAGYSLGHCVPRAALDLVLALRAKGVRP